MDNERQRISLALPGDRVTRRTFLGGSLAVGLGTSLAACGGTAATSQKTTSARPSVGGAIRIGMNDGGSGDTLNPFEQPLYTQVIRSTLTQEHLFEIDIHNNPIPALALSAEPNKDATAWKVNLRPDVVFSNGKRLTADDVLYSYTYGANPKLSDRSGGLSAIDIKASRKLSDTEVLFVLSTPVGGFTSYLASGSGNSTPWIVPAGTSTWNTIIGTGPYKLTTFVEGQESVMIRRPDYWGSSYLDKVTLVPITDPSSRMDSLLSGEVQAIYFVEPENAKEQARNPALTLLPTYAGADFVPFYVQIDTPPFNDNDVRTALKLSVNRPELITDGLLGFGSVGNDVAGKGFPTYNAALPQHHYDPEQAKFLLKKAGHEDLTFTLYTSAEAPGMLESATVWKAQAASAGISINLVQLPSSSYFSNNKYLKVPVYQSSWGGSFENWAPLALFKGATYNETHWDNPAWQAKFTQALGVIDEKQREDAFKELEVPVWQDGGYILWGYYAAINAVSSKVHGAVPTSGFNMHPQDWWL